MHATPAEGPRPADRLRAPGLLLHRWCPADTDDLLAVVQRSREHLLPWMPWAHAYDGPAAGDYIRGCETAWAERERFDYRIAPADGSRRVIGSASLMARVGPGALEIGYWVDVDSVGRGVATRAAAALTVAGLALPGVRRIEIHHHVGNTVSGRIPERLGYTRAGEYSRIPGKSLEPVAPAGAAKEPAGNLAVWVLGADELAASFAAVLASV
jgi:RimJ/RimL family protein N-acetyltransferase